MLGDNTGVYRIDGLFLNIKSLSFTGTLQGLEPSAPTTTLDLWRYCGVGPTSDVATS